MTKISAIKHILNLQTLAGNSVLLLGPAGIGKTEVTQQWLTANTDKVVVIDGSQTPADLVQGVPFVSQSKAQETALKRGLMTQMDEIKAFFAEGDNKTIGIDIEELSSFNPDDQRTLMNMFLSGRLPDGSMIPRERLKVVATANPSAFMDKQSDASVNDIETAILTRMAKYDVEADVKSWLAYAIDNDVHQSIIYALQDDSDLFKDEKHLTTPRTLVFLSNMFKTAEHLEVEPTQDDVEALIGDENASKFKYYFDKFASLMRLEAVLGDEETRQKFNELSDAEKSVVFTTGLKRMTLEDDEALADLLAELPVDTQMQVTYILPKWATETSELAKQAYGAKKGIRDTKQDRYVVLTCRV